MPIRKSNRHDDFLTPALNELVSRPFSFNDPSIVPHWKRYLVERTPGQLQQLCTYYMPLVRIVAGTLKKRRPEMFNDELGVYLSDGFLGLECAIRGMKFCDPKAFITFAWRPIKTYIFVERRKRLYGRRHCRSDVQNVIAAIRGTLTRQLGRLPMRDEMVIALRAQIENPGIYIAWIDEGRHSIHQFSQLGQEEGRPLDIADPANHDPSGRAIGAESMRLAMKGLKPLDRKIFKLLLGGVCPADIARRVGLTRERIRQRLNGVLWESRQRADLASALGVEPDAELPARLRNGLYPNFEATPARLVG